MSPAALVLANRLRIVRREETKVSGKKGFDMNANATFIDTDEVTDRRCGYDFRSIPADREYCDERCKMLAEAFWAAVHEVRDGE